MHLEEKQSHVQAWQTSGLTKSAYAQQHDLNSKTLSGWCRDYHQVIPSKPGLVPVSIRTAEVSPAQAAIKLQLRSGSVLEFPVDTSPRWLSELLQCLD